MLVDTHIHMNDEKYNKEYDKYLSECEQVNVKEFICVGSSLKNSIESLEVANKYKNIYAAIGIHPYDLEEINDGDMDKIEKLIQNNKVIAVGEVGLDFHYDKSEATVKKQLDYFIKFIDLANKHDLPIIIHSRDATDLTYRTLKEHKVNRGGIVHCYSGSKEYVKKYVELGFYFGIGGVVTFKNAKTLVEAVNEMPIDRILLETDGPYLAPTPHRGETNHSKYIPLIAQKIAEIKQKSIKEIEEITTNNYKKLFFVEH